MSLSTPALGSFQVLGKLVDVTKFAKVSVRGAKVSVRGAKVSGWGARLVCGAPRLVCGVQG